jgi:16S rRNA (adenine1518-N6/adenine1519-N6)-dimethyltransferase
MDLQQIQSILKQYNIAPTKKRGQNFLVETSYLDDMIEAGAVTKKDTVLEVGPGLGVLTQKLAEQASRVITIELDKNIIKYLHEDFLSGYPNVELIEGDALSSGVFHQLVKRLYANRQPDAVIDPKDDTYKEVLDELDGEYKLIANLPYQVTSKLMRQSLEAKPRPSQLVVMVQKEVAKRIVAKPGSMSLLALSVQAYSTPVIVKEIPANAYYPIPAVDSAILHCDLTQPNQAFSGLDQQGQKQFWRFAKAGYSSKRKQLQNNLQSVLKNINIEELFTTLGFSQTIRAQELSVDDWVKLVHEVQELR